MNAEQTWSGSPDPFDPDNFWIDDDTGERVNAATGERTPNLNLETEIDDVPVQCWQDQSENIWLSMAHPGGEGDVVPIVDIDFALLLVESPDFIEWLLRNAQALRDFAVRRQALGNEAL